MDDETLTLLSKKVAELDKRVAYLEQKEGVNPRNKDTERESLQLDLADPVDFQLSSVSTVGNE